MQQFDDNDMQELKDIVRVGIVSNVTIEKSSFNEYLFVFSIVFILLV